MSLAILCPGQGGQHRAMFDIVAGRPAAESVIAAADAVLPAPARALVGGDIFRNRVAQPLICAAILARWHAIAHDLPTPSLVLGYSVGELAAHAIAGTFAVADCLSLAARRAELMDEASPPGAGLIAVLGMGERPIRELCTATRVEIAIVNGAAHFVLGGPAASLDAAAEMAASCGARVVRLNVEAPAHTTYLFPATEAFRKELAGVAMRPARIPVLAGIDGHVVRDPADAAATLAAQIAQTVNWSTVIAHAIEMGATVFFELGPGDALARMVRDAFPSVEARSLDEFRTLAGAVDRVRRSLDWRA
jgi:[acyl-carrier-protein] S-malonyltransferase